MKKELEQKLQSEFPFMFNKNENVRGYNFASLGEFVTAIPQSKYSAYEMYGCQCDDGWYSLIRNLCIDITSTYQEKGLEIDLSPVQIKEKFGALHFHFDIVGQSDMGKEIMTLAKEYKERSKHVCESCGSEGEIRTVHAYVKSLCDSCYQKQLEKKL